MNFQILREIDHLQNPVMTMLTGQRSKLIGIS